MDLEHVTCRRAGEKTEERKAAIQSTRKAEARAKRKEEAEKKKKLINCPACETEISRKSTSCVHCGEPIPSEVRMRGLATRKDRTAVMTPKEREESTKAIIFVIVVLAVVTWYFWPSTPEIKIHKHKTPAAVQRENVRMIAIAYVQSHLKSPSTANFYNSRPPTELYNNDNTWTVVGDVDSQNGFGAMIRSKYVINLKPICPNYKSMTCWSITSASIK